MIALQKVFLVSCNKHQILRDLFFCIVYAHDAWTYECMGDSVHKHNFHKLNMQAGIVSQARDTDGE